MKEMKEMKEMTNSKFQFVGLILSFMNNAPDKLHVLYIMD